MQFFIYIGVGFSSMKLSTSFARSSISDDAAIQVEQRILEELEELPIVLSKEDPELVLYVRVQRDSLENSCHVLELHLLDHSDASPILSFGTQ